MFRKGRIVLVGVCAVGLAVLGVAPAVAQSSSDTPKATEIGVTAKEIHIAVGADVDNPFAPGLFKGAVDGVKGAAKYINSKAGGGGIAGRKLVVDFIDSHLSANDSRVHFGLVEICCFIGIGGVFLATFMKVLEKNALRPMNDPRVMESLAFQQPA